MFFTCFAISARTLEQMAVIVSDDIRIDDLKGLQLVVITWVFGYEQGCFADLACERQKKKNANVLRYGGRIIT